MSKKPKNYSILNIRVSNLDTEFLPEFFFQRGCSGLEELSGDYWKIYFPGALSAKKLQRIVKSLSAFNASLDDADIKVHYHMNQDWLTEWKKFFKPIKIGKNIWVYPPWEKMTPSTDNIHIVINPQMAFGTGHHETTQLMIELMEQYLNRGDVVLDVGTGSGILAILAKKSGAKCVYGIDIDTEAIANAKHNAELNDINEIVFIEGSLEKISVNSFDLVLANINRLVLQQLLPNLIPRLNSNGILILSGLLEQDIPLIMKEISPSLTLLKNRKLKEWWALVCKK